MLTFLAKPQTFLVKPAPGWLDLARVEVSKIFGAPLQPYKFAPEVKISGGAILVGNCDYRQAIEMVMRSTLIHDVEWVLYSGRVTTRTGWQDFFSKAKLKDIWPAAKDLPLQLTIRVTHPVVGTEKEVRQRLSAHLETLGIRTINAADDSEMNVGSRLRLDSAKNRTQLLLSLSGRPLYIRSYKEVLTGATAPLPEHHAAACFRWALDSLGGQLEELLVRGEEPVIVPFAGTGTFGFESVCQILHWAPALFRSDYAFKRFIFHPDKTSATIERRLRSSSKLGSPRIIFGDVDSKVCEDLRKNIAGFEQRARELLGPDHTRQSFACLLNNFMKDPESLIKNERRIFLLLNPPFGERLAKKTGSQAIYASVGKVLKHLAEKTELSGLILCADEISWREFLSTIGRIHHKTRHFTHGGLDIRAVVFSNDLKAKF